MPDGVVLLDSDNSIIWGNGRIREWSGRESVAGVNFYAALGTYDQSPAAESWWSAAPAAVSRRRSRR